VHPSQSTLVSVEGAEQAAAGVGPQPVQPPGEADPDVRPPAREIRT